jgi:drug/metabolite transporter (DMT)-like permease
VTAFALTLILIAAVVHAMWNFLAKRASGGAAFSSLFSFLSTCLYTPIILTYAFFFPPHIGGIELIFIAGSSILHVAYFLLLQQGYRVGDLSVVYPLARGTGPLLSTLGAIALFGEHPSFIALCGAILVIVGVFIMSGGARLLRRQSLAQGISYGLITGAFIAAYTLWDKQAVSVLLIPPLIYEYSANLGRSLILAPLAWHQRDAVMREWRTHRYEALGVAALAPLSYLLVLVAMTTTPVSYVAPARELSILIGAMMGARWLGEGETRRRLTAAGVMVLGVMALAVG